MKAVILRSLLACAGLAIVYLFSERQLTLLIDRIKTARVRTLPAKSLTLDSDMLRLGELGLELRPLVSAYEGPDKRIVLAVGKSTFALDPADDMSLTVEHSLLSWPTPFEMNFMTGHAPSWKRNVYNRLVCKKRSGPSLELLWRYEEWFYSGLGGWGGRMTRDGVTGLIRADLRP